MNSLTHSRSLFIDRCSQAQCSYEYALGQPASQLSSPFDYGRSDFLPEASLGLLQRRKYVSLHVPRRSSSTLH